MISCFYCFQAAIISHVLGTVHLMVGLACLHLQAFNAGLAMRHAAAGLQLYPVILQGGSDEAAASRHSLIALLDCTALRIPELEMVLKPVHDVADTTWRLPGGKELVLKCMEQSVSVVHNRCMALHLICKASGAQGMCVAYSCSASLACIVVVPP